jgi:uncharacterized protein (TIGR02145 family)
LYVALIGAVLVSCNQKQLEIESNVVPLSDYGSNDGSISITISGGKEPYAIKWSNNQAVTEISNLAAGTYIVNVTDTKGRIAADTLEVTGPDCPICIDNEGNSYKTTIIGDRVWMAENLKSTTNSNGDEVKYFQNPEAPEQGLLYTWDAAMNGSTDEGAQGLCPDGWHIPTHAELTDLSVALCNDSVVENLINPFNLVYAGFYNGDFQNVGNSASLWSSSKAHDNIWKLYYHKNLKKAFIYYEKPQNAISVRCVKD